MRFELSDLLNIDALSSLYFGTLYKEMNIGQIKTGCVAVGKEMSKPSKYVHVDEDGFVTAFDEVCRLYVTNTTLIQAVIGLVSSEDTLSIDDLVPDYHEKVIKLEKISRERVKKIYQDLAGLCLCPLDEFVETIYKDNVAARIQYRIVDIPPLLRAMTNNNITEILITIMLYSFATEITGRTLSKITVSIKGTYELDINSTLIQDIDPGLL